MIALPRWLLLALFWPSAMLAQTSVQFNEIQVVGTHNSYHVEPRAPVMELIEGASADDARSIAYTHRPLEDQLRRLGIRQLEWDLYADPEGGLYAEPLAHKIIASANGENEPSHDPDGLLDQPGLKILHAPDFDYLSTSLTFHHALTSLRWWSQANRSHIPILVLVELKESGFPLGAKPFKFDDAQLDGVDQEILAVFDRHEILAPDDVRGDFDTLRNAVTNRGWPALDSVRGKIMFALDNGGSLRDQYLEGHASLKGRLLFASVDEDHPAAAWFKINNPVGEFDRIQRLVRVGFMVRTRADAGTKQARENDVFQREKAFASGAQFISTDYPEANKLFSAYQVRLPGYDVARTNPINGSEKLKGIDLETPLVKTDVRIAAYNVLFGNWATPEAVGTMFLPYDLDIIGFSEVPNGDWTARVGKVLGMEHAYVGEISSANHVNKYKSILSRTPLTNTHEIDIPNHGWSPASLVGAETNVKGVPMLVYATHIPGRPAFIEDASGAAATFLAESVIPQAIAYAAHVVLLGDLNHWIGDAPFDLIEAAGMHSMWKDLEIDTQRLSTHQHIESGTESGVIDHILWHPSSAIRATQGGVIYNGFNLPDTDRTMERYQREWEQSGKPLSDHRPVWVSLEFTNTPSH